MKHTVIASKTILYIPQSDLTVLIEKQDDEVSALNFMFGDDIDEFHRNFSNNDKDLLKFYNAVEGAISGNDEIGLIQEVIFAYVKYKDDSFFT
jgi:hypothetical protein